MGVDLILLPIDHESDGWGYSHTVLSLERATALWEPIRLLPEQAVPASFATYLGPADEDEPHYGDTQEDAYGERLSCTTAGALRTLVDHPAMDGSAKNRAAWAYLGALPPQTRVALYWHEEVIMRRGRGSSWSEAAERGDQDDDGYARGPAHCLRCGGFLEARARGAAVDEMYGHGYRFPCRRCGRDNWLTTDGWQ